MSGKRKPRAAKSAARVNTPLLFLLLAAAPLFGAYYTFIVCLCGAVCALLLAASARREGALSLPLGPAALCLYGLCACFLLTIPFAISPGLAAGGFFRALAYLLFFLYIQTYSEEERRLVLDGVALEGALLSAVSSLAFLYDSFLGAGTLNGRVDGLFQYANTWALYQLVCLLLLLLREKRRRLDWPAMAVLLLGVFLSGSRWTILLAALCGLLLLIRTLRKKLPLSRLLIGLGAVVLLALAAELLSGGLLSRRLLALGTASSSLNGRLLYWSDGLKMLLRRPWGLGREGFFYLQSAEQTGVYTVRFAHNEYLQAALDGGVLAGLLLLGLALAALLKKGTPLPQRLVMLVVALHAFADFDLQYGVIVFLFLLCLPVDKLKRVALTRRRPVWVGAAALSLCLCLFSVPYLLDYAGQPAAAHALFPAETELAENALLRYTDPIEAEPLADEILRQTELSLVAWDCKAKAALARGDGAGECRARLGYLRLSLYREEAYAAFAAALERAWPAADETEREELAACADVAIGQARGLAARTSPLAWRLADQPDLSFVDDLITRLRRATNQ